METKVSFNERLIRSDLGYNFVFFILYSVLARKPTFAWKLNFYSIVNQLYLEFVNQAKNISVALQRSRIKIWGKRSWGSWVMIGQTNTQTDKQRLFIYLDAIESLISSNPWCKDNNNAPFTTVPWNLNQKFGRYCRLNPFCNEALNENKQFKETKTWISKS